MFNRPEAPRITYLKEYTPPDYLIDSVNLTFELGETDTKVIAQSQVRQNPHAVKHGGSLRLAGQELELLAVKVNGKTLNQADYQVDSEQLVIPKVPEQFSLEIVTRIKPQQNTELSGLFYSNHIFCTQCEAEGFRRITYFLDRPDVLARYKTTIIADKTKYPILLSNGNLIAQHTLSDNRHAATWEDPFRKPCYLFALVAGDLDVLEDKFVTCSGRTVTLKIFVDKGQLSKAHHAMHSLQKAMRWDEEAYGREYDLDIFMLVAINDFNMGAMENKGLNIFNAKYVLVKPETATDSDYEGVLIVVGHEYLHNWSGDRVTCRDWFQLSLKEGLTVFREQEFTADMTSALVSRVNTVKNLRHSQFREDSGPLAHPVQPDSYIEINNFYTATIYSKGAEVIRMMKVLLGAKKFREGMDLYFSRYDGCAVTIEDLIKTLEDASGHDLTQFRLWYKQAGTPELEVHTEYDQTINTYTMTVKQSTPATPQQAEKKPLHIPFAVGLLDSKGNDLPLLLEGEGVPCVGTTRVLELKNPIETFRFVDITEKPTPSLLRNFSAPVKLSVAYTDTELQFLLAHDCDGFNRWEAAQQLGLRVLLRLIKNLQQKKVPDLDKHFVETFRQLLADPIDDKAFLAELLTLPSETYLGESMDTIDVDNIHRARQLTRHKIAQSLKEILLSSYQENLTNGPYANDLHSIGQRRFKNICLGYLMLLNDSAIRELCLKQLNYANNMTDQLAPLIAFANTDCPEREDVLAAFYEQWQHESLVIEKWFAIQAASILPGTLERVKALLKHPAFKMTNPNKVRSLIGVFCHENLAQFHDISGAGYQFLADNVLQLDKLNSQIAARLLEPMTHWRRFDAKRQELMQQQLQRIAGTAGISKDVFEIVGKSLVT